MRRLGIFLSRKGSMEAVQKKMNIYGKYLPMIAQFSTELAGKKDLPDYKKLIGEGGEMVEVNDAAREESAGGESEIESANQEETDQETIDKYGGS